MLFTKICHQCHVDVDWVTVSICAFGTVNDMTNEIFRFGCGEVWRENLVEKKQNKKKKSKIAS